MPATLRVALLLLIALLAACAGHAPAPSSIQIPTGSPHGSSDDVLFRALGLVGTPYRYGGNTPDGGFDCSGLIGYVYRDAAGIRLPRSTRELSALRAPTIASREALQSGDLVFFATNGGRQVSHAGIYVGEGRFVHAPSSGGTVRLDSLSNSYWQRTYLDAKRVFSAELARNP
ncbi:C40 family peptidase [Pseudomonas lalucatii]|uniref:C40 family peptidase n=1 Tax=Pseudomonas lalucatii TaxID=1424203 RepID=A0ABS5PXY5_9PSED|nr:C40 family peptidase [Pseudomonas lalucatii]MBS7661358.1 C40 family peptidase [Pseudomonas lalucatii]MBS7724140.1 C40 family peptidase [Pseudomonas lalucatii]QVM87861.1 C40 family peptidase [Pseudomonas lalucatii]